MGTKLVLCVILVAVLAAIYIVVQNCSLHCAGRNRSMFGPVNPNAVGVQIDHKNPCDFIASQGYKPEVTQACDDYAKKCGTSSTLRHVVEFSQMYDPFDPDAVKAMQTDAANVMDHPEMCVAPAPCSTSSDCQPMGTDFGLTCKNILCVPNGCQPGEECTPGLVCNGSCL